jgi:RHS repeat-associated protein
MQLVWSPTYVNDLVLRDRDPSGNGNFSERLYVQQDANHNVTAITNSSNPATVQERFVYDPYGSVTVLTSGWSTTTDTKNWLYLFQGGRWDSYVGLYDFQRRELDPVLGRWIQQDPTGYGDGASLYQFEASSPVDLCDPFGLAWRNLTKYAQGQPATETFHAYYGQQGAAPWDHNLEFHATYETNNQDLAQFNVQEAVQLHWTLKLQGSPGYGKVPDGTTYKFKQRIHRRVDINGRRVKNEEGVDNTLPQGNVIIPPDDPRQHEWRDEGKGGVTDGIPYYTLSDNPTITVRSGQLGYWPNQFTGYLEFTIEAYAICGDQTPKLVDTMKFAFKVEGSPVGNHYECLLYWDDSSKFKLWTPEKPIFNFK